MLVLAVEVSQSAASPTMSNPVESWLKYLGWAALKKKKTEDEKKIKLKIQKLLVFSSTVITQKMFDEKLFFENKNKNAVS